MHAAVVITFDSPPSFEEIPAPEPQGQYERLVDVIATGLHPRVRSQADGSHYTSTDELPLIPGIDGVGRTADGQLRYFILPDTTMGAMAEQTVIDIRRSIPLPADVDPIIVAALMNPAMSSWVALRQRIAFHPGQSVLVLGATGNAGRLAIQVAKHLGAGRVIAAGRGRRLAGLAALGADDVVDLSDRSEPGRMGDAAGAVDVVLDYLWGEPTTQAMIDVVTARPDEEQLLTWVQIGSVAGTTAAIPSAALRAVRMQIVGSGQGSVGTGQILAELADLTDAIVAGTLTTSVRPVPLADVTQAWSESADERIVITP